MKDGSECLITVENFEEGDEIREINRLLFASIYSPRSLEACKAEGVLLKSLKPKSIEDFSAPGKSSIVQQLEYDMFNKKRQGKICI